MEFIRKLATRLETLILKLVGFEGLIWIVGTVGLFRAVIPAEVWLGLSLVLAGIKTYQKYKHIAGEVDDAKR